jgi:ribosomal protein S18 acetylase RimI-like enzyme
MAIEVTKVTDQAALREFCELPLRLHPPSRYVPVPERRIRAWYEGTGPQRRYGPVDLYLARDHGGRVVGRTYLHRNSALDARVGRQVQLFGLTEFADGRSDPALVVSGDDPAKELLDLAEQAGAVSGCDLLLGPVELLPDQSPGVLVSGFAERGFSGGGWSPAYYPTAYERLGFTRRWPGRTWIVEALDDPGRLRPEKAFVVDEQWVRDEKLRVHRGSRRSLRRILPVLRHILNASAEQVEQRTEVSAADFAERAGGLSRVLDERLPLYLTRAGEPVAFLLAVPDVSPFLVATRGRPSEWQRLALRTAAWRGNHPDEAALVASGTLPQWQGQGYLTLLARELYRALGEAGYRTLRGYRVPEGDRAAEAPYRGMGGRPLHRTAFYERRLR